jgi:hypothetical protein
VQAGLAGLSHGLRVEGTFLLLETGTAGSVLQLPGLLSSKQRKTRGVFLTELSSRTAVGGFWRGAAGCCVHGQPELLSGLSLQGGCSNTLRIRFPTVL